MSNLATITNNILADSGIDDINVIVSTGSYANPAWITSLAWTKITGAPLGDYLPLVGGTMTGNINWAQTDRGITWGLNSDGASIKFYNIGDGDTDSRLEFATLDNDNEYFRWVHIQSGGGLYESMRLVPVSSGNAELIVRGKIIKQGGTSSQYLMADGSVSTLSNPVTGSGNTNYLPKFTGSTTIGNSQVIDNGSQVGIGINPQARLQVFGGTGAYPTLGTNVTNSLFISRNDGLLGTYFGYAADGNGWIQQMRNDSATAYNLVLQPVGGNLLVGTTSDNGARLQVSGTSLVVIDAARAANDDSVIQITNTNSGSSSTAQFFANNGTTKTQFFHTGTSYGTLGVLEANQGGIFNMTSAGIALVAAGASGILRFATGGTTERMRIFSDGNVLIQSGGTFTNNGAKLQVSGTATVSSFITAQSSGGSGLRIYGGSGTNQWDMYLNGANIRFSDNTGTGSFVVDRPATFSSRVGVGGASATYPLTAYNASNGTTAAFGGTARGIRIDNDGTFSSGRSTIFGVDSSFYGSYQPLSIEASSLALQAVTGGNVGIGTPTPFRRLEVVTTSEQLRLAFDTSGSVFTDFRNDSAGGLLVNTSNSYIIHYIAGTPIMRMNSNGNVLIANTTSDNGARLQVTGTATFSSSVTVGTDVTLNSGTLFVSAGSGQAYSGRLFTAYIFPYITTYLDSFAGPSWEGRLQFRTNSSNGAMNTQLTILNSGAATFSGLAGSGNRIVVANSGGTLISAVIGSGLAFDGTTLTATGGGSGSISGSGTSGTIALFTGATSIGNSAITQSSGNVLFSGSVGIGPGISFPNGESFLIQNSGVWNVTMGLRNTGTGGRQWNIFSTNTTFSQGAGKLLFYNTTASTDAMVIDGSNNVGIGTTGPNQKLEVNGRIRVSSNGSNGGDMSIDDGGLAFSTQGSTPIAFWRDNYTNQSMRIFSDGNVFIGSSPSNNGARLQVSGTATFSGSVTANGIMSLSDDGTYGSTYKTLGFTGNSNGSHRIFAGTADNIYIAAATARGIEFWTNGTPATRMFITSGGNVGIGTPSPSGGKLQVNNGTNLNVAINTTTVDSVTTSRISSFNDAVSVTVGLAINGTPLVFQTEGSEKMRITSGGNVLIGSIGGGTGTASPVNVNLGSTFSTTAGSNLKLTLFNDTGGSIYGLGVSNNRMDFNVPSGAAYSFYTGNVLINTTSDNGNRLRVNGTIWSDSSITATSFFESSDATLKTLIADNYQAKGIDSVVAKLYIKNGKEELGYFAQDLQDVLPSAVSKGSDGLLNLSYREVHTAKIAYLEERIKQLEKKYENN